MVEYSQIRVIKETKMQLDGIGNKGQTYDEIIGELIEEHTQLMVLQSIKP